VQRMRGAPPAFIFFAPVLNQVRLYESNHPTLNISFKHLRPTFDEVADDVVSDGNRRRGG
jgi:hypothetical protein